jgi:hypothetical protein
MFIAFDTGCMPLAVWLNYMLDNQNGRAFWAPSVSLEHSICMAAPPPLHANEELAIHVVLICAGSFKLGP